MKKRIVLLGPPASGKGTQAELISARYRLPITSPGAILREERRLGTSLGIEADRLTSKGMLMPDEIIVELVERWLFQNGSAFIFDGFPRSLGQAESLERLLAVRGTPLEAVLALEADVEILEARVAHRMMCSNCGRSLSVGLHIDSSSDPCPSCGGVLTRRSDDTPETLAVRLQEYAEKTEPLSDYYASRGLLHRIQSTARPEVVFESIRAILEGE
ncbi:MAG: nucleoside monophosphate kinase [Verrucomicrobiaceae bacterium]|nr:MAG: nucleoside monophosphate kinase [Verrucomicrobiaceae bacterium]